MLALSTMLLAASVALADIRPLLREQGFSGPLNGREQISFAGQIRQGRSLYQVYTYHGVLRAAVVDHGVNRIIVIRNRTTFLGDYAVSMPVNCHVRGLRVICDGDRPEFPKSFTFTLSGPPAQIWFDSENPQFAHPGRR